MNERLNQLLQENFVTDGPSKLKYESLTEAQKFSLTKNLLDSSIRMVLDKTKLLDYSIVEASKGNIQKVPGYSDLAGSIQSLKSIQSASGKRIEGVDTLDIALMNLKNLEAYFSRAFAINCTIVEMMYNNVAVALISSTAYLIANAVDMVKNDAGVITLTPSPKASKGLDSAMVKSLDKFNKMCANGDMQRFLQRSIPEFRAAGSTQAWITNILGSAKVAGAATFVVISSCVLLRQIVFQFYNMRVKLSDYLRTNATFVEMNQAKMSMAQDMQGTRKKQQEAAKKLLDLADKIDIDQKVSAKKASLDISKHTDDVAEISSVSSDDDLLF